MDKRCGGKWLMRATRWANRPCSWAGTDLVSGEFPNRLFQSGNAAGAGDCVPMTSYVCFSGIFAILPHTECHLVLREIRHYLPARQSGRRGNEIMQRAKVSLKIEHVPSGREFILFRYWDCSRCWPRTVRRGSPARAFPAAVAEPKLGIAGSLPAAVGYEIPANLEVRGGACLHCGAPRSPGVVFSGIPSSPACRVLANEASLSLTHCRRGFRSWF